MVAIITEAVQEEKIYILDSSKKTNFTIMNLNIAFNEAQWLKLLFLLADTQNWMNDLTKEAFLQLPLPNKKQCFQKDYYLSAPSLAHILERHYFKISRHPQVGKFHIPLLEIVQFIRDAAQVPVLPVSGTLNYYRTFQTSETIGEDKNGNLVSVITIITDNGGKIITAFPGLCI